MRPRLAITLSGQPRTWRACADSLLRYFSGFEVTVFLHSWDDVPADERAELLARYRPHAHAFEPRPDFSVPRACQAALFPYNPQPFVFDMAYGLQRAIEMAAAAGPFDWIARVRFDAMFDGVLDPTLLRAPGINVCPSGNSFNLNDLFAVGAPADMAIYGRFLDWLITQPTAYDKPRFVSEYALLRHLQLAGVAIHHLPHDAMKLVRPNMVGRPFAQIRRDLRFYIGKSQRDAAAAGETGQFDEPYAPYAPLFDALDQQIAALSPDARHELMHGDGVTRLLAYEAMIGACPAAHQDARTLRAGVTYLLSVLTPSDITTAYDAVLGLLSFEADDRRPAHHWLTTHPEAAAALVRDPILHATAPGLMCALQHMVQAFNAQPPDWITLPANGDPVINFAQYA